MPTDLNEFIRGMLEVYPNATCGTDNDGQLIIYTNLQLITSEDNPTVAEGHNVVQEMD